jgi:hypothetical protein
MICGLFAASSPPGFAAALMELGVESIALVVGFDEVNCCEKRVL